MRRLCAFITMLGLTLPLANVQAEDVRSIPDEFETASGFSMATSNAGVAMESGAAAAKLNPGLLALTKEYSFTAGYHWPISGREFYTAGVVDSTTSDTAAALTYTGYLDPYDQERKEGEVAEIDSPIIRRGNLAIAQNFGSTAIGIGAQYIEANPHFDSEQQEQDQEKVRGLGMNLGAVMQVTKAMRFAASGENLSNDKIKDYAPRMVRVGATYQFSFGSMLFVDFRQRDRIRVYEQGPADPLNLIPEEDKVDYMDTTERMVYGGGKVTLRNNIELRGVYGASTTDPRRTAGAGIRINTKAATISYAISKPYLSKEETHQALQVGMQIRI